MQPSPVVNLFARVCQVRIGFGFEMEPGTWEWIVELISDLYFVAGMQSP